MTQLMELLAAKRQAACGQQALDQSQEKKTSRDDNRQNKANQLNPQPEEPELRVDPVDGLSYSLDDFLLEYGDEDGRLRWKSAGLFTARSGPALHKPAELAQQSFKNATRPSVESVTHARETHPKTSFGGKRTNDVAKDDTKVVGGRAESPGKTAPTQSSQSSLSQHEQQQHHRHQQQQQKKKKKTNPARKKLSLSQLKNKNTKLMKAAKGGRLTSVEILLAQKAQVRSSRCVCHLLRRLCVSSGA